VTSTALSILVSTSTVLCTSTSISSYLVLSTKTLRETIEVPATTIYRPHITTGRTTILAIVTSVASSKTTLPAIISIVAAETYTLTLTSISSTTRTIATTLTTVSMVTRERLVTSVLFGTKTVTVPQAAQPQTQSAAQMVRTTTITKSPAAITQAARSITITRVRISTIFKRASTIAKVRISIVTRPSSIITRASITTLTRQAPASPRTITQLSTTTVVRISTVTTTFNASTRRSQSRGWQGAGCR
jgi:hypothetical protein